ncbi:hypothetical protein MNBD_GAMMA12-168 [hydrothermal vent metagenome]|uniref:Uncharacterized protein n=1 Tax=hydrothermal vent metagenome TaxID=652676 RepID=A0A3B0Z152_9ZZZZ
MKANILKGIMLLMVISIAVATAWILIDKPVGQYDKAARAMLDRLYHPQYQIHASDKIDIKFDSSSKIGKDLYALNDISFHSPVLKHKLQAQQFKITRFDHKNKFPHFFTIKIRGLKIHRNTLPGGLLYLPFLQLRIKKILADATIMLDYNPSTKTLSLQMNILFRQLFKVHYQLKLKQFSASLLEMIYAASRRKRTNLEHEIDKSRLVFSSVKLSNTGFLQQAFKSMSPAMLNIITQNLNKRKSQARNNLMKQGTQALIDFLQYKKSITITIAPIIPIGIKEYALANNRQKRKLLNTRIQAEKPAL